jgi:Leucine-rich repeat (LRR) protein
VLSENKLTRIGNLPQSLIVLNLDFNEILAFEDYTFTECFNLRYLSFKHNKVQVLPKSLFKLNRLQVLDMSNNLIVSLKDIHKLESLQKLYIQNNKFLFIPYEMKDAFPNLI